MNKERRAKIDKAIEQIEMGKSSLEDIMSDEQDAFDSMPESLQEGERGQASQSAIDSLQEAIDSAESAIESAGAAKGD